MVKTIEKETFFHINSDHGIPDYLNSPMMQIGQELVIGNKINPFFHFYEKFKLEYPVTDNSNGKVKMIPAMAYFRNLKDGKFTPNNIQGMAKEAFDLANHFLMFSRELIWENVRLAEFPQAPSRQKCVWLTKKENLQTWINKLNQNNNAQIVKVEATGKALFPDSSFLMEESELYSESLAKARKYWNEEKHEDKPEPEVLFEGKLKVMEIVPINNIK